MSSLIAAGAALAVGIIGMLPVALDASRHGDVRAARVTVAGLSIRLGGKQKREKTKKPNNRHPSLSRMKILVKNGYTTLCRAVTRVRVDRLAVRFTAGGSDPAAAAELYAAAGAALDTLSRLAQGRVSELALSADVELLRERSVLEYELRASVRAYRLLWEAARFGLGVMRDRLAQKLGKG